MEISSILGGSQSTTLASLLSGTRQQESGRMDLASKLLSDNDADADGFLSADEMGLSDSQISKFDTDGDSLLSQAELDTMLRQHAFLGQLQSQMSGSGEGPEAQMASDLISTYDADGDGSLSASEMGMTADELAAYDTDGDGLLNSTELADGLKADKEAMTAQSAPPPPPPGETDADAGSMVSSQSGGGSDSSSGSDPMDTNGDGVVSTEEYEAWMTEHGFTLGADSQGGGSDSSLRSLLAKAMEAYQNQAGAFSDMFLGQGGLGQGLFSESGLGLSATA